MNKVVNLTTPTVMTSREISELTRKKHAHVLRDIDNLLKDLNPELRLGFESSTYKDVTGKENRMYIMDRDSSYCLVAGYDANSRMRIIKRWQELETKSQSTPAMPATDLDLLIQQNQMIGNAMVELRSQREALQAIQQDVSDSKSDIADIKAALPTAKTHTTIRAYAATHNVKLQGRIAQRLGKRCAHITINQGKAINSIPDDLYGTVNAYPNAVVEQVFSEELLTVKKAA